MALLEYHYAWLSAHPERTEEWLRERMRDGFDVHHGDGDRTNNDPSNLFLIDHVDHMRLHNLPIRSRLSGWYEAQEEKRKTYFETGRAIYEFRKSPMTWRDAYVKATGDQGEDAKWHGTNRAQAMAKKYAQDADMPYPPDVGDFSGRWRDNKKRA